MNCDVLADDEANLWLQQGDQTKLLVFYLANGKMMISVPSRNVVLSKHDAEIVVAWFGAKASDDSIIPSYLETRP